MDGNKVACVIVTYNRRRLLEECLEGVKRQTSPLWRIYVIDNCSTDDTEDFLEQFKSNQIYKIIRTQKNLGGAGGFSEGIEYAVKDGADWLWLMDDDTIPNQETLANLMSATKVSPNIGFLASKVVWTDGTPHRMNLLNIHQCKRSIPFNTYSSPNRPVFNVLSASFVSVVIRANCVKEIGLPYSEFFIWKDDSEYTSRIVKAGYLGLYVDNSVVVHKTAENYLIDVSTAPASTAWKFYYDARNRVFVKRVYYNKGKIASLFSALNYYRQCVRKLRKRKDNVAEFKKNIWRGCIDGLSFNPTIRYVEFDT